MRTLLFVTALAVSTLTVGAAHAKQVRWEQIGEEDGIKVWQRSIPGQSLVEFRGRGVIDTSFLKILAVLADHKRKTEWMDSCVKAYKVRDIGPGRVVMYNRTGSTVPLVSDRDVVLESNVDIWPDKRRITIDVWSVEDPAVPPEDGVVRMPDLRASWVLTALDPERTDVTYTVRADPGGALPHWLVNMVAKRLPLKTIQKLRKQSKKPGYDKELATVQGQFDWSGFVFEDPQPQASVRALDPATEKAAQPVTD